MAKTFIEACTALRNAWIHLMHSCFAQSLLDEIARIKKDHDNLHERYVRMTHERNDLTRQCHDLVREDGKIAAEIYNMRTKIGKLEGHNPLAAAIDSARNHASRERIRDLEAQLRHNNIEPQ